MGISYLPKLQCKHYGFHQFLGHLVCHRWNPLLYMMTITAIYLYNKIQLFMCTWNISRFIIIWCDTKLKMILLSWCIATQKILLQMYWPRLFFFLTNLNISNAWRCDKMCNLIVCWIGVLDVNIFFFYQVIFI